MMFFKNIKAQFFIYAVWALMAVMFWSWIYGFVTDTGTGQKVTVFADVARLEDKALAIRLEKDMPEGIKMIKVHSFEYAMFDSTAITSADIYIINESDIETYLVDFRQMDFELQLPEGSTLYYADGLPYGIKVHNNNGLSTADEYIGYGDNVYYMFFGKQSPHFGEQDNAAVIIAERILDMR